MNLLASELGMGRSKLYTKLKEITGLTPNEFTLKLKLEEAMHLLNNAPHLNVTEISYRSDSLRPDTSANVSKHSMVLLL